MADKRVIEQTASTELFDDDWFLKDSVLEGTTKISASVLAELFTGDVNDRVDKLLRNIIGPTYEWSASKTYKAGAIVYYEDSLYFCIVDTATVGTFVPSEWRYTDLYENLTGKINSVIKMLAPYMQFSDISSIMPYSKGDIVRYQPTGTYKEKFYVAKEDLPEGIESYDPNDWDEYDTIGELIAGVIAEISDNLTADGISYDNTTSGLEADDVQEAIDEVVTDIESVETALETKAEVDGFYDDLYAGNLLSDNTETDNAPYTYRQSPSGKSCVDLSVVGGTVAWNQLVVTINASGEVYGITRTDASSGNVKALRYTGTSSQTTNYTGAVLATSSFVANHVFYATCGIVLPTGVKISLGSNDKQSEGIFKLAAPNFGLIINSGTTVDITIKPQAIDLTQAFGSTIADYVYSLEQAEAGSGIAWLKSYGFLTKDYYAYQSGKLESVNVSSRKVVGKNLFDVSKLESGLYSDSDFTIIQSTSTVYRSIKIFLKAGTYVLSASKQLRILRTVIDGEYATQQYDSPFTVTLNKDGYLGLSFRNKDDTDWISTTKVQLEFGSTATVYEPYNPTTYPLSPIDLRGIPKLDSNNNLYYDGDIYESDGSVKRKYGVVDLGAINWDRQPSSSGHYWLRGNFSLAKNPSLASVAPNIINYKYLTSSPNDVYTGVNKTISIHNSADIIIVCDDSYTDATAFKTAMDGVYLVYELDTPTTESATPYSNPQLVGSTEEFIDTRDVAIPAGQDSKYHTDLKAKLEELAKIPDVPSTNGTYTLKATRSASGVTYSWVSG